VNINKGISVTGGQFTADVVAVGDRARAIKVVHDARSEIEAVHGKELSDRLETLVTALEAHADELEEPDEVFDSAAKLADELKTEKPNKLTVRAILSGIVGAAPSVVAVTQAATAVAQLLALAL
jgi:exonuclease VII small subunit